MFPAPPLAPPLAEAVVMVRGLAEGTRPGHPATVGWSAEERAGWLVGLRQLIDTAEGAFTQVLADFDAAGDGQLLHAAPTTQSWLRGALGMAGAEASERVRIARASRSELAPALEALLPHATAGDEESAGEVDRAQPGSDKDQAGDEAAAGNDEAAGWSAVSFEHVRSIARTVRALPPSTRDEAAGTLTGLASQLGVDDLRAAGRHLRQVVDPDGSARHAEEDFSRRWLSLAPLLDGMASIDGVLDAETASHLTAALAPFLVPAGPDDLRTTDQRRADGLAQIVITAVKAGDLPTLSGASVALQVQVPLATLTGHSPAPAHSAPHSSTPIWFPPAAAQRLSCDASIGRVLLDPAGIPLELGRQTRVFTSAQRRALTLRDAGCRFPNCSRPALHTDAHHLTPWAQGGTTDLTNGLLLCRHHHRQVHEGGWTIHPTSPSDGANSTLQFTSPTGNHFPSPIPTAHGPSP